MRFKLTYLLSGLLSMWLFVTIYFLRISWKNESQIILELKLSLKDYDGKVKRLEEENSKLRDIIFSLKKGSKSADDPSVSVIVNGPPKEYEETRRKIYSNIQEMGRFCKSKLKTHKASESVINDLSKHNNYLLVLADKLSQIDGYSSWRKQESEKLRKLVRNRITSLQNPKDCVNSKKLICNLNKGCGYGCQLHHAMYCFVVAFGTNRTLILNSRGWRYNKEGFEDVFKPLSDTCSAVPKSSNPVSRGSWPGSPDTINLNLPIVDGVNPRPKFLPPAIPEELADKIIQLHGNPIVWWLSEFFSYMLQPQPDLSDLLLKAEKGVIPENGSPYVGIHVRRTDKIGSEAAFHHVEEYMEQVENRFAFLDLQKGSKVPRIVYVASDDPKVLGACRKKFPDYVFHGDSGIAKSAAVSSRYTSSSLKGVIIDIHLLSKADFLVCTFSSQVCRLAYEIMQSRFVDGTERFSSLDDIWYFGGQDEHQQEAVLPHIPVNPDEIELKPGDIIGVAGNHWNGYNKGRNHRTGRIGLYPEFKTKEKHKIVSFPSWSS